MVEITGRKMMEEKNGAEKMKEILESLGIELAIWGCGCCDSPWVTFKYKGETIVNDESPFNFDNISGKEKE